MHEKVFYVHKKKLMLHKKKVHVKKKKVAAAKKCFMSKKIIIFSGTARHKCDQYLPEISKYHGYLLKIKKCG